MNAHYEVGNFVFSFFSQVKLIPDYLRLLINKGGLINKVK